MHKPGVQIDTVLMTNRNEAAIAVDIAHGAADLPTADPVGEGQCRLLSAAPALTLGRGANLSAFRGIDPMQPDALSTNFQCIAVDHAGNAGQAIGMGLRGGNKREQKEGEQQAQRANQSFCGGDET